MHIHFGLLTALVIVSGLNTGPAGAHDAPSGWQYPMDCCQSRDCRPISSDWIRESAAGYTISVNQETVPYGDTRVKDSPDGLYHWCTIYGRDSGPTICLYVPPRAY